MIRWIRKHRPGYRKSEPLIIELFEALVRTVAAAPAEPSGFAMLSFDEEFRHPLEPLPPEPEPEPPDIDEGAITGWFAVPAAHLDELPARVGAPVQQEHERGRRGADRRAVQGPAPGDSLEARRGLRPGDRLAVRQTAHAAAL